MVKIGTVPTLVHEAFRNFREGRENRRLALQILKSQAWKSSPSTSDRKKQPRGRLTNRALSGG
ncbi:hypothetical protein C6558_35235 [Ensifer sp. NM-2]|nr:hypothetical protein C6558_35235 [Ensifer sp. NM-2]